MQYEYLILIEVRGKMDLIRLRTVQRGKRMIRIAVVEDEDIYANQLGVYLHDYAAEKKIDLQIDRFTDGDEITEQYSGTYHIILMDIQMRFMDGMTAAEKIRQMDTDVIIIFITNMTEYAVRGYEVDALDYVVKPIQYFAFSRKMDRAVSRIKRKKQNFISVTTENGMRKLNIDDILYLEVQDHTLFYHTEQECLRAKGRCAMKEMEQAMLPYNFYRSNQCYLVNMKRVEGVEDNICVVGDERLQISRTRRKGFMNALVQYIGEEK